MTRHIRTIAALTILIAAMFIPLNSAFAYNDAVNVHVFLADYDAESGQYYGAYVQNGTYTAIAWELNSESAIPSEDNVQTDDNGYFYADFEVNSDGSFNFIFQHNNHEFAWRVLNDGDIGTIANLKYNGSWYEGTVNGESAQIYGSATNGAMFLLREARLACTIGCSGYMVQNGNLIRYVLTEKEETPKVYTLYVAVTMVSHPSDGPNEEDITINRIDNNNGIYSAEISWNDGNNRIVTITSDNAAMMHKGSAVINQDVQVIAQDVNGQNVRFEYR